jgi:hypothetical protein
MSRRNGGATRNSQMPLASPRPAQVFAESYCQVDGAATVPVSPISAPAMGTKMGRCYDDGAGDSDPRGTAPDDPAPSTSDVISSTRAPARNRKPPAASKPAEQDNTPVNIDGA